VNVYSADAADPIRLGDTTFNLRWQSDFSDTEQQQLQQWLQKAVNTAGQLYGEFPLPQSRIEVSRSNRASRSPVPWGQTLRQDPEGVSFSVNTTRSLDEFIADWTAPHEFSHLFIPYPGQTDIWLSEGFASYYQNILMAREGIYSPEIAWQKLYAGFIRAEREGSVKKPLAEVSETRRQSRATMRIYWSGALYFLEADIALRTADGKIKSLDDAVKAFNQCCRNRYRRWDGAQLVAAFDEVSETTVFSDLYARYRQSTEIPDSEPVLKLLGIASRNDALHYADEAPVKLFREQFTQPILAPLVFD